MSPDRSGAVASEPMQTVAPASSSSGTGQRAEDRCDGARIVRDARAGVRADAGFPRSVRPVECDRSASGPRMPSSLANFDAALVWPSCVKTRPRSRLSRRASTAWRDGLVEHCGAEFRRDARRRKRRRQHGDVDAACHACRARCPTRVWQVAICCSNVTGNSLLRAAVPARIGARMGRTRRADRDDRAGADPDARRRNARRRRRARPCA